MKFLSKKYASAMAFCAAMGAISAVESSAAELIIWDENGVSATLPPKNIYSYESKGDGATKKDVYVELDTAAIDDAPYYMLATFMATIEKPKGDAGFGFKWKVNADYEEINFNVSGYSGVCLNYTAENPVRMEFIQSDIDDFNYFGYVLPATGSDAKNKFVPFDSLVASWASKIPWTWRPKLQEGVQFSYKANLVSKYGTDNTVKVNALRLADECPSHAPEANPYLETEYELEEGDVLTIEMASVFRDLDGDDLTITATFKGTGVNTSFDDTQAITLKDKITFTTVQNPAADAFFEMEFVAVDPTNKKVSWKMTIKPIDRPHNPTIKDSTFEVLQGEKISFSKTFSFYGTLAYDLDGDDFDLALYEEPEVGEFKFDVKNGRFTYDAPSDFSGDVYFSLYAVQNDESVGDTVRFKIHVIDINDPPTVEIVENSFDYYVGDLDGDPLTGKFNDSTKSVLKLDEDFEDTVWVEINTDNVVFDDVDSDLKMSVKSNDIINAKIVTFARTSYIEITPVADAYGLGKISYCGDDGEFSACVNIFVKVASVDDPPVAKDDEYNAVQDSTIKVAVAKGVLVNDINPDDEGAELTAKLKDKPKHGKLTLNADGSFKYEADAEYKGEETFTYICVNELGIESEPATVTLKIAGKNTPPVVIREDVVDSLSKVLSALEEDKLLSAKSFKFFNISTWFEDPDGDELTFDAINEDGKLTISKTSASITIAPAPDSSGLTEVIFVATDSLGATAKLVVPFTIKAVNDKPVVRSAEELRFDVDLEDWEMEIDLDSLVTDIDGDTLKYEIAKTSTLLREKFYLDLEGSLLKVSPHKTLDKKTDYILTIVVSDAETSVNLVITFTTGTPDPIKIAAKKELRLSSWQDAVTHEQGLVSIMDVQGRVMWTAKLPVTESQVRAEASKVQGRKVLKVNRQTWTIK